MGLIFHFHWELQAYKMEDERRRKHKKEEEDVPISPKQPPWAPVVKSCLQTTKDMVSFELQENIGLHLPHQHTWLLSAWACCLVQVFINTRVALWKMLAQWWSWSSQRWSWSIQRWSWSAQRWALWIELTQQQEGGTQRHLDFKNSPFLCSSCFSRLPCFFNLV